MEKIWIKKELYFEKYEFLKFYMIFSDFYLIFNWIFKYFFIKNREKGGEITCSWRGDRAQTMGWRGARVHRAVTTWRWGHVAGRVWPARGAGGADVWQEATRTVHVGARVGRHVAAGGVGMWRAHGLVGPG